MKFTDIQAKFMNYTKEFSVTKTGVYNSVKDLSQLRHYTQAINTLLLFEKHGRLKRVYEMYNSKIEGMDILVKAIKEVLKEDIPNECITDLHDVLKAFDYYKFDDSNIEPVNEIRLKRELDLLYDLQIIIDETYISTSESDLLEILDFKKSLFDKLKYSESILQSYNSRLLALRVFDVLKGIAFKIFNKLENNIHEEMIPHLEVIGYTKASKDKQEIEE